VCQLMGAGQEPIITTAKSVLFFNFSCSLVYKDYVFWCLDLPNSSKHRNQSYHHCCMYLYKTVQKYIYNLLKLLKNVDFNLSQ
jgi:hypothetical protein